LTKTFLKTVFLSVFLRFFPIRFREFQQVGEFHNRHFPADCLLFFALGQNRYRAGRSDIN